MAEPALTKKFIIGEAYYRFGSLSTKFLGFFTTFYVLSSLTVYQYGVFQLLLSVFAAGIVILYLAARVVGNDIQRFISLGQEAKAKKIFLEYNAIRLLLGASMTAALFFAAPLLSVWYKPDFIALLQILSFYFIVEALSASLLSLATGRLQFRAAALEPALGKLAQLGVLIGFSLTVGVATREALIAGLIGNIAAALSLLPAARRAWREWRGISTHEPVFWNVLRGYGKWDAVRHVISSGTNNIQPWLIKFFISTEAVAIYSVALTLVDVAKNLVRLETLATLVPRQLQDREGSRRMFVLGIKYLLAVEYLIMAGSVVAVPIALSWFFPDYLPSLPYFYALLLTLPPWVVSTQAEIFLVALREQPFLFTASLSRSLATPALLLLSLPAVGLWGAVATRIAIIVSLATAEIIYLFRRHPELRFSLRELFTFTGEDRQRLASLASQSVTLVKQRGRTVWRTIIR